MPATAATPDAAIRRQLGRRLASIRDASGLTQRQLAEALTDRGIDTAGAAVSVWETGSALPSLHRQIAIAEILGCTVASIFGLDELPEDAA